MKKILSFLFVILAAVLIATLLTRHPTSTSKLIVSATTADSAGQLAEGFTFEVGTNPTDQVTCVTTSAMKACELNLAPGTYSVVAKKAGHVTMNTLVDVAENDTKRVQMYLPKVPTNQPVAGDLVPIADFVLAKGTSQNMAGLFRKYDNSLTPIAIPAPEITLSVASGSSATVSGMTISATQTLGATKILWCNTTPCDDESPNFTVVVY